MYDMKAKASSHLLNNLGQSQRSVGHCLPSNCIPAFPRVQERTSLSSFFQHTHLMLDSYQLKKSLLFIVFFIQSSVLKCQPVQDLWTWAMGGRREPDAWRQHGNTRTAKCEQTANETSLCKAGASNQGSVPTYRGRRGYEVGGRFKSHTYARD